MTRNIVGNNISLDIADIHFYHYFSDRNVYRETIFNVYEKVINNHVVDRLEITQEDKDSEIQYYIYLVIEDEKYDYGVDIVGFPIEKFFTEREIKSLKKEMLRLSDLQYIR